MEAKFLFVYLFIYLLILNYNWLTFSFKVADQQAAVFGQCCFDVGDVNCTMGTGSFIDINTGSYPHASVAGNSKLRDLLSRDCNDFEDRHMAFLIDVMR